MNSEKCSTLKLAVTVMALVILSGCSSRMIAPVPMNNSMWAEKEPQIAVAMTTVPASEMVYPGADCLLCLGAAAAMNSSLSSHSETFDLTDIKNLKAELVQELSQSGKNVVMIDEPIKIKDLEDNKSELPNSSIKDYSTIGLGDNISHLLLVDLDFVGIRRNYASYVPTSDPFANIKGRAFLLDLSDNTFKWYLPFDVNQFTEGEWDEPDQNFPGLTNSYYQAIEVVKGQIKTPLKAIN